jgi:antitoxin Phd
MQVYTFSEARQKLASILEQASKDGEVQIKRRDGRKYILKPESDTKSPLDVKGVDIGISASEIVDFVRKGRERTKI